MKGTNIACLLLENMVTTATSIDVHIVISPMPMAKFQHGVLYIAANLTHKPENRSEKAPKRQLLHSCLATIVETWHATWTNLAEDHAWSIHMYVHTVYLCIWVDVVGNSLLQTRRQKHILGTSAY